MIMSVVTPMLCVFLQQQPSEAEIEKAINADAAAGAVSQPSSRPAPASTAPAGDVAAAGNVPGAVANTAPGLAAPSSGDPSPPAQAGQRPGASLMNPALSVIVDGVFGYYGRHRSDFEAARLPVAGDDPSAEREGFGIQEVELAFQSAIDPDLDGALFLTIPNLEGIEVEEAYLVTTSLPWNLQLKAGTFRSQMGRNNTQHLHVQHFTRRPLFTSLLFGADGMRGPGAQASVLLPLPWFATVYVEAFTLGAPDDTALISSFGGGGRGDPKNLTYAAILEQYWDATENASLMLGLNAATGRLFDCGSVTVCPSGGVRATRTVLYGGDLTYRWRPANVARSYASVQWTTELFFRSIGESTGRGGQSEGAGYTEPVVQVSRRWYVGGRFDLVGIPSGESLPRRYGYAVSLTFAPSEFSRFRLYAQEINGPGIPSSTVAFFQSEISLGAHGAHTY